MLLRAVLNAAVGRIIIVYGSTMCKRTLKKAGNSGLFFHHELSVVVF